MTYSFGEKLKQLRIARDLSQDELAEKINEQFGASFNKSMISRWESGLGEPRMDSARLLVKFFGTSMDEMLGLKEELETIAAHHEGDKWTEEEQKKIEEYKELLRRARMSEDKE